MGYKVKLTELQREHLIEIVSNGKQQAKVIMHANILLQSDCSSQGPSLKAKVIAENLNVHERTVHRVRQKYTEEGIEAAIQRNTPKHGSWLNMAEIELSHLFRQCLNRRLANIEEVRNEATTWMHDRNENAYVTHWQFTVDDARIKLKRLYPTVESDKKICHARALMHPHKFAKNNCSAATVMI